jgi:cysteine desulfurase family protein (TIGR01976 family)
LTETAGRELGALWFVAGGCVERAGEWTRVIADSSALDSLRPRADRATPDEGLERLAGQVGVGGAVEGLRWPSRDGSSSLMPRLLVRLVIPDRALLEAAIDDREELGRILGCEVAEGWSGFPEALRRARDAVAAHPDSTRWGTRLFVLDEPRTLVGWGGFKGPPRGGVVELGYEIAPSWRGRGLAGAAVHELLREAFAVPEVRTAIAHTLAEPGPSVRVLEKAGFVHEGEVPDDEVGTAWRFRLERRLDVGQVRARFPALASGAAFLDGPGGSQAPREVLDAIAAYLRGSNANLGGAFPTSRASDELMARARSAAAEFTGGEPEGIAFGANMTTLNFLLAHAVARTLEPGDEIVVSALDHDANVSPWLLVARDHDLVVRTAPIRPEEVTLNEEALEELIGARTRVVAFTLASNAVGSIPDAARIAAAARRAGALAWADGVHLAPHRRLRAREWGLDVVLCSPYKFFGPHLGIAAIRVDLAESLPADRVRPACERPAGHRFETGTQSHEAIAGAVAAIDYLRSLGDGSLDLAFERIEEHETRLAERFLAGLPDEITLYGIRGAAGRTPTFCFNVAGHAPRGVAARLADEGIYVWDGNYYALEPMRALGLGDGGAVRAGFLHYTTEEEVDRLLGALRRLAS